MMRSYHRDTVYVRWDLFWRQQYVLYSRIVSDHTFIATKLYLGGNKNSNHLAGSSQEQHTINHLIIFCTVSLEAIPERGRLGPGSMENMSSLDATEDAAYKRVYHTCRCFDVCVVVEDDDDDDVGRRYSGQDRNAVVLCCRRRETPHHLVAVLAGVVRGGNSQIPLGQWKNTIIIITVRACIPLSFLPSCAPCLFLFEWMLLPVLAPLMVGAGDSFPARFSLLCPRSSQPPCGENFRDEKS